MIPVFKNKSLEALSCVYNGITHVEEWKPIDDYSIRYEISTFGRIKSLRRNIILSQKHCPITGYLQISLYHNNGARFTLTVHRIVAKNFIPNPENKPEVNHKEADKTDNRYWMLEWNTSKENSQHAKNLGLLRHRNSENHPHTYLTNEIVMSIFKDKGTAPVLAAKYKVPEYIVYQIKNGQNWSHVTGKKYLAKTKRMDKETVLSIFNSPESNSNIARKYSLSMGHVWDIKMGNRWSSVTGKKSEAFL